MVVGINQGHQNWQSLDFEELHSVSSPWKLITPILSCFFHDVKFGSGQNQQGHSFKEESTTFLQKNVPKNASFKRPKRKQLLIRWCRRGLCVHTCNYVYTVSESQSVKPLFNTICCLHFSLGWSSKIKISKNSNSKNISQCTCDTDTHIHVYKHIYTDRQHMKNKMVRDVYVFICTHAHVHTDILVAWVASRNRKLLRVELATS